MFLIYQLSQGPAGGGSPSLTHCSISSTSSLRCAKGRARLHQLGPVHLPLLSERRTVAGKIVGKL